MIEMKGKKYARVSDILKPLTSFDHINPFVLSRKANIGTLVHQAINDEILGEFPYVSKECEGYFESFCKWRSALNPQFERTEHRFFDDDKMISGQIDALVKFPNSPSPILIDFKTSSQESPIVWPMQGHLYQYLLKKNWINVAPDFLFVKLDKTGNFPMVFKYSFDSQTLSNCMVKISEFWEKWEKC